MSGGLGSRFWPKSRKSMPKQFLKIVGDKTMIECTIDRIKGIIDDDKIYVVTNKMYAPIIKNILKMDDKHIFMEPLNKETATCIGLAAVKLLKKDFDATMVVLPSDHYIEGHENFEKTINRGIQSAAEGDFLVTLGINPTRPESGYGYIEKGDEIEKGFFKVKRFVEKPNVDVAKSFIEKGSYLWNSGMFIWRADRLLREIKKYIPELYRSLMKIYEFVDTPYEETVIKEEYEKIDGISIDFGVMQRTHRAAVIETNFVWDDIGSFNAFDRFIERDKDGNIINNCNAGLLDVKDTMILGNSRMIAAIGIKDMIIVDTEDVVLICPRERCQDVKELVKKLSSDNSLERFV